MKRKDVIVPVAITSGLSAGLSIVVAVTARVYCPTLAQAVEYPIVAAWTLLPPLWFCFEWVFPFAILRMPANVNASNTSMSRRGTSGWPSWLYSILPSELGPSIPT